MHKVIEPKRFSCLKTPSKDTKEPIAEEVGIHYLSRMISKKTKFRVADVEEVVRELSSVVYSMILDRKTVNLDGMYIRSKWQELEKPMYIRDGEGYWIFGYFYPKIEMDMTKRNLYSGKDISYNEKLCDKIIPYCPDYVEDFEDLKEYIYNRIKSTSKLGKAMLVDEDGYIINPNSKKKKYFDEEFHPTWGEICKYHAARSRAIKKWKELRDSGEDVAFHSFIYKQLESEGYKLGSGRGDLDE